MVSILDLQQIIVRKIMTVPRLVMLYGLNVGQ